MPANRPTGDGGTASQIQPESQYGRDGQPPLGDEAVCQSAILVAEHLAGLPPHLLAAIAITESGRTVGGRTVPWPWTINVGGTGYFFASKAAAVDAVRSLQAASVESIDIGCMQVNLLQHPGAFQSLDQAFDPAANAIYAAQFLASLFRAFRSWPQAAAAYHSQTPELAAEYGRKVMAAWPDAAAYGGLAFAWPAGPAAGRAVALSSRASIDPYHVYTPEFAREVALEAAFRARRNAMMLGLTNAGGTRLRVKAGGGGAVAADRVAPRYGPERPILLVTGQHRDRGAGWPRKALTPPMLRWQQQP
jgi:hypothetical protein